MSEIFPLMEDADLSQLADDIKANGQKAPITLLDGKILDGRNRHRACLQVGIEPRFKEFKGNSALEFILSANLHRRHLSESQRAVVAAKIVTLNGGGRPCKNHKTVQHCTLSAEQAAKQLNVGERNVKKAKTILSSPSLTKKVESGKLSVNQAAKQISRKKEITDRDDTGYPVPDKALAIWNRRGEVKDILRAISAARSMVRKAYESDDILFAGGNLNSVLSRLNQAYTEFEPSVPYAVCPICQGQTPQTCQLCKGKAIIGKFHFDTCVPEELKAIRASTL